MPVSLNKAQVIGHLGADPETKTSSKNIKFSRFTVATTEKWKNPQGEDMTSTEWHQIVCFGKISEIVEKYLQKGMKVFVEGKIQTRKWEDEGITRYSTEIVAQQVIMLDRPSQTAEQNEAMRKSDEDDFMSNPDQDQDDLPF